MKIPTNSSIRVIIACGAMTLYGLIFLSIYPSIGIVAMVLNVIPAVAFGWLFGIRGSLYFPLMALPVNFLLLHLVGDVASNLLGPNLFGCASYSLVSLVIGWIRNLNERVHNQAEELQAERNLLQEAILKRIQAEERLIHEALHDPLTDLPNRRLFYNRLEHAMEWSKRNPGSVCAVAYLDLNRFKSVNDRLGHEAGDQVLTQMAGRLKSAVRQTDTVARMGGDEFAVLLEAASNPNDLIAIIQRIQSDLAIPYEWKGDLIASGASIGVVIGLSQYEEIDQIVRDADTAMFRAKVSGNNEHNVFTSEISDHWTPKQLF
jgi:diguanylate cyclase (GGDEF)-like protein